MTMHHADPALTNIFARFREIVERAEEETKRYGSPDAETRLELDTLDTVLLAADLDAAARRRADNAFARVLRRGYRSEDSPLVTLMADAEPAWDATRALTASKAMTEANDTTGGFLASPAFATDLLHALQDSSPVRQVATLHFTTEAGELLPVVADVQSASRVSEVGSRAAADTADLDLVARNIPVHEAFATTSVSRALVMDSKYPLEQELINAARIAFAKLEGKEFIKGTGNGEFKGLDATTLPTANVITSTDSTNHLVLATDLQKLFFETMNAAYLQGARLLLNKKTLGKIRQLTATSGAIPMFPVADTPGTLAGIPYTLCADMDEVGSAGKNAVYLLSPRAYTVVQRQEVAVLRLEELYAESGKILFHIFMRSGGQPTLVDGIAKIVTA